MNTLKDLIGKVDTVGEIKDPFLAGYGLARNPFPPARTVFEDLIYNQDNAIARFADRIREVLQTQPQRRALGVIGGTGGGKTHFLRHCQWLLRGYEKELPRPFIIAEVLAGSSSSAHLLREIYRQADEVAKRNGEYDFLTATVRAATDTDAFDDVKQPDLRHLLVLLFRSALPQFVPTDRAGIMRFEALRDIAHRWLLGGSLSNTERKHIGVFGRLASAAMMARVLTELLSHARKANIVEGVMVCLDEVETLFSSGASTGKVQAFLQDLRYFYDESVRGNEGYSLLIVAASTQNGAANLTNFNYPLFQRLGFDADSRAELQPINGLEEAKSFSKLYIDYEKKRAKITAVPIAKAYSLLTDEELADAYSTAANAGRRDFRGDRVNQAQFLEALHDRVEMKRQE